MYWCPQTAAVAQDTQLAAVKFNGWLQSRAVSGPRNRAVCGSWCFFEAACRQRLGSCPGGENLFTVAGSDTCSPQGRKLAA